MSTNINKPDILIIGAGLAGLSFAIKCAQANPDHSIVMLTKASDGQESNTRYAQGGIATVWDELNDSAEQHVQDTLNTGDGLCRKEIVELVVQQSRERLEEMITWGTRFDLDENSKNYQLAREGGHSANRILHYKDITGQELMRSLSEEVKKYKNIHILDSYFALDFITQHHMGYLVSRVSEDIECYGCYALNHKTDKIETFLSRITVCCSGGIGQVYRVTTNPSVATGDGIAMAYRAKARVEDMEFVQFHPTAFFDVGETNSANAFLISEAVRGAGAKLRTPDGKPFMKQYDERGSLASRDIVARAIDAEMKKHGSDCMYLDCSNIDRKTMKNHFPTILEYCLAHDINPAKDMIPVAPACHYLCGGIQVNQHGQTSISNLFAIGECSSTGLHGANRLASNSLLECIIFAHQAFKKVQKMLGKLEWKAHVPDWNAQGTCDPKEMVLITQTRREVKQVMSNYVGIVRSDIRLQRALDRLFLFYQETEKLYQTTTISPQLAEVRNLITVSYLITRAALDRKESRGLHYTTNHTKKQRIAQHSVW